MAIKPIFNNAADEFLAKPRGDRSIRVHISRNALLALLVSIILHVLVLLLIVPKINVNTAPASTSIEVTLAPKKTAPVVAPTPEEKPKPEPELEPKPEPKPKVIVQKPSNKPNKPKANDFSVPKTITIPQPSPQIVPPSPTPKPQPSREEPKTFEESMAQRRAQREAAESDAARQNAAAAAAEQGPSEEAKRDARIKNNFNNGTNGIFEITNLGSSSASFSFLGWTSSVSNARREFFDVEAKNGQDVRLVMIRRMIAIIREHYQGDFDWQSQRLGRTIIKSARVEDSAELEDFLMQEFFGTNYKTKQ
jgi:outer membrane biosynthesis protein TonB